MIPLSLHIAQRGEIITMITIQELVQHEVIYCVSSLVHNLTQQNKLEEELAISLWQGAIDYEAAEYEINQDGSCLNQKNGLWGLYDNNDPDEPIVDYEYETRNELIQDYFDDRGWDINEHRSEVFEHWIVSSWLALRLIEQGETVVECYGLTIWCRTTTGQAIYADYVIQTIYQAITVR